MAVHVTENQKHRANGDDDDGVGNSNDDPTGSAMTIGFDAGNSNYSQPKQPAVQKKNNCRPKILI